MADRRSMRWLVWFEAGVVLLPALAMDLGLPGHLATWGFTIVAGLAIPLGCWALLEYSWEAPSRPPLSLWLALVCGGGLMVSPLLLLTWPDGGAGGAPVFTFAAATLLAILQVLPVCIFDAVVKRAWLRAAMAVVVVLAAAYLSSYLSSWIVDWKDLKFRG